MTQERLQELIDKCGAVWTSISGGYWFKLNPKQYKIVVTDKHPYYDDGTVLLCYKKFEEPSGYDIDYELTDLREDVDRALWERDMTAEQVVKFTPPMWEDIKGTYGFKFIKYENGNYNTYEFELVKKLDDKAKYGGWIFIWRTGCKDVYHKSTPTKKDYIKACKIVMNLLKGDKE